MGKLRVKNGFEYRCERYFFSQWVVVWRFRPQGEEIFIEYYCDSGKTTMTEMEALLLSPSKAADHYRNRLQYLSDVDVARLELKKAEARFASVNSPDFDLRGNNPNREARVKKDAHSQLVRAENRLQIALDYSEILKRNADSNEGAP